MNPGVVQVICCMALLLVSDALPVKNTGVLRVPETNSHPHDANVNHAALYSTQQNLLFEGDIAGILAENDTMASLLAKLEMQVKNGELDTSKRWSGSAIPYVLDPSFTQPELEIIFSAMQEYKKTATIFFFERNGQTDYVYLERGKPGTGCTSYVGKIGGKQVVNLEPGCLLYHHGAAVHELMHAAGFWHEQSRPDRDDHVEINWDNIQDGLAFAFMKYGSDAVTTFDKPYDYTSVMHYDMYAFAKTPGVWTIRGIAPFQHFPTKYAEGFSSGDIEKLNAMYPLCATLYEGGALSGYSMNLPGSSQYNLNSENYDAFSSAKVSRGCSLTICRLINYQGGCVTMGPFTSEEGYYYDFATMTPDFNWSDAARSVKCSC